MEKFPRFAQRCFTEGERAYAARFARPARRFAARFAGKEAVMKSLGRGWRQIRWTDVEITGGGPPKVVLRGSAAARAAQLGVTEVLVTITHTDDTALVMAVAVGEH
jgi:holo-[acyl-carrier protein] synthase